MTIKADLKSLVSIFDLWTWLSVLFSLIIIPLAVAWFLGNEKGNWVQKLEVRDNFLAACLVVFKAMVEQGDPVTKKSLLNYRFCRTLLIPVIIMGIIVSTTYKNENITRITLPRATLAFDNISVLVDHKFTILSRVLLINNGSASANEWIDIGYRLMDAIVDKLLKVKWNFRAGHEVGYGLVTELFYFVQAQNS